MRLFDHTRITRTDTILQLSHALNLDIDIDRQEHKDRLRPLITLPRGDAIISLCGDAMSASRAMAQWPSHTPARAMPQ